MQVILLFLHAPIKTTMSNYISRKMSVSHDIIFLKLPIRVLFCCFLCRLLNRFRLSHACHTRFLQWFQTLLYVSIRLRFSLGSEDAVHTSSVLQVQQLHTADILRHTYCQFLTLLPPKMRRKWHVVYNATAFAE